MKPWLLWRPWQTTFLHRRLLLSSLAMALGMIAISCCWFLFSCSYTASRETGMVVAGGASGIKIPQDACLGFTLTLVCVAAAGQLMIIQWQAWVRGDQWSSHRRSTCYHQSCCVRVPPALRRSYHTWPTCRSPSAVFQRRSRQHKCYLCSRSQD